LTMAIFSHERLTNLNNVLANSRFLPETESATNAWAALMATIDELTETGEILEIPERNGADAWRNAWKIYLSLRDRRRAREHEAQAPDRQLEAQQMRNARSMWDSFTSHREALEWEIKHGGLSPLMCEFIGFDPASLVWEETDETRRFGKPADWRGRADACSRAIGRWKNMDPEEKRLAPLIVALRRQAKAIEALEERVAALEGNGRQEAA